MNNDFESKRTIEEALDIETGELILSKRFFKLPEDQLIHYRRRQQEAINGVRSPKFVCPYCLQLLKISGKSTQRGLVSFFAHLYDSEECEIKTNGHFTKEEIEAIKYAGIKESQRHIELKDKIFKALSDENSSMRGVSNIAVEKRIKSDNPLLNWRRPDVSADFNGNKIVFELQLSTTFLSIIVARDLFYKLNGIYILWVFNFSSNTQYLTLENLMCKDIYYANKRNAFIFDDEAQRLSQEEKELVLLCIWFEPILENQKLISGQGIRHQEYIKISDLRFDNNEYKPYYIDADKIFTDFNPNQLVVRKNYEHESSEWIKRIEDKLQNRLIINQIEKEKKEEALQLKISEVKRGINEGILTLKPFEKGGKWGYACDDIVLIEPYYNSASDFNQERLAKVSKNRKFGYIDNRNNVIVPLNFHELSPIRDFCFIGRINNKWFRHDLKRKDRTIKELECEELVLFRGDIPYCLYRNYVPKYENGYRKVRYDKTSHHGRRDELFLNDYYWGLLDLQGMDVAGFFELIRFKENEIEQTFEYDGITNTNLSVKDEIDTIILVREFNKKGIGIGIKFNLMDIEHFIERIGQFSDYSRLDKCILPNELKGYVKLGLINKQSQEIARFEFDSIIIINDSIVKVQKDNLWGYVDIQGEQIIPTAFDDIYSYGELRYTKHHISFALADQNSHSVNDSLFPREKLLAKRDGLWGIIDTKLNPIIPFMYEDWSIIGYNYIKVKIDGLFGLIDLDGHKLVHAIYEEIEEEIHNLWLVKKNDLWGLLDEYGKILIPIVYEEIHSKGPLFCVKKDGLKGIYTESGQIILNCIYQSFNLVNNEFLLTKLNGYWGYNDLKGNVIVKHIYDGLSEFYRGETTIRRKDNTTIKITGLARYICNGKRGYVDKIGKEYWQYWKNNNDYK